MQEGSAAVLFSFLDWFPRGGHEGALEEGVVYDILLVIFACNDPVPGANLVSSEISNDPGIVGALTRFDQQGSTCAESIHKFASSVRNTDENYFNSQPIKMA
ncbi:MAG TPA: hypothetical protein VK814_09635 [Acidobacteriaceae bacterium]|jgi:hypothetical protein|nr:hypothetical protein [Acidobacteriaceae bacterium]